MIGVRSALLFYVLLSLLGCTTATPELGAAAIGAGLHSFPSEDALQASLSVCESSGTRDFARYVGEARSGVNSWFEVVRTIDQCNIDSARYYTSAETM